MANDQQFYNQRAADIQAATNAGNPEAAAQIATQVLIEEGPVGLTKLTEAVNRNK